MPIEIDFVAHLANPSFAVTLAFTAIACLGFIAYRIPAWLSFSEKKERLYLRKIAFLAELLVAVGLIGLITFAGRAKLENKRLERAEATREVERDLSAALLRFAQGYCMGMTPLTAPTQRDAILRDGCALWREHSALYRDSVDWVLVHERFESLSKRADFDRGLSELLHSISFSILKMVDARNMEAVVPLEMKIVARNVSWPFLLMCAAFAVLGVALKCARAARERQVVP